MSVDVYYGAGLLLKEEEVNEFVDIYSSKTGKIEEDIRETIEYGEELMTPSGPLTITHIEGTCSGIEFSGWVDNDRVYMSECYFANAERQLPGQNMFAEPPYEDMEELVEEFCGKLGKYLPDGFKYEENIGFVVYAMAG